MMLRKVDVLIGGQFGSEGKGVIAHFLAPRYDVHVRVGGPNAGHTFNNEGTVWKMQSVPCGWTNPDATLIIGRGAVFTPRILQREIRALEAAGVEIAGRLFVDARALVIESRHEREEGGTRGSLHAAIGSTGEGVGAARLDLLERRGQAKFAADIVSDEPWLAALLTDTVGLIQTKIEHGAAVLLEGTQGFGLSLTHGFWPYVTSHDTGAAQLCADAGVGPTQIRDVFSVFRTHPIRVSGNSGPLRDEMTWDELSRKLGREVVERTTVTNKIRRVGRWDESLFLRSNLVNRPTSLAVTFLDYLDPGLEGRGLPDIRKSEEAMAFLRYLETIGSVPIRFVGTGGDEFRVTELSEGSLW